MNPGRVWKTLTLHGPMTARQVAARWAVVEERDVYRSAEWRVRLACRVLAENELVKADVMVGADDELAVWVPKPMPADDAERRALLKFIEKRWREVRPPSK